MVLTTPEQVNFVHWTRFDAVSVPVDWSDHHVAHKTVMRLFDPNLGTTPRSNAGVLFRIDPAPTGAAVLVQSTIAPMFLPAGARQLTFDDDSWQIDEGAHVRLRVAVNPIARLGSKERVRSVDEAHGWILGKLAPALGDIDIVNAYRDVHTKRVKRAIKDQMTIDSYDAIARVTDPAALNTLRIEGVGRRRAYGCGLLTAQRIG